MSVDSHAGRRGFTVAELVTALVVVAVLAAVAVPLWHAHLLRLRRADATGALIKLQAAQDQYFGRNARYANAAQLKLPDTSAHGYYKVDIKISDDGLAWAATARAAPGTGQNDDSRCVEFSLDQNDRRRAADADGNDRSADCWH